MVKRLNIGQSATKILFIRITLNDYPFGFQEESIGVGLQFVAGENPLNRSGK